VSVVLTELTDATAIAATSQRSNCAHNRNGRGQRATPPQPPAARPHQLIGHTAQVISPSIDELLAARSLTAASTAVQDDKDADGLDRGPLSLYFAAGTFGTIRSWSVSTASICVS
jgi:hypothetical protein